MLASVGGAWRFRPGRAGVCIPLSHSCKNFRTVLTRQQILLPCLKNGGNQLAPACLALRMADSDRPRSFASSGMWMISCSM